MAVHASFFRQSDRWRESSVEIFAFLIIFENNLFQIIKTNAAECGPDSHSEDLVDEEIIIIYFFIKMCR